MKQKSKKLILLFIVSLVMILGFATIVNAEDSVSEQWTDFSNASFEFVQSNAAGSYNLEITGVNRGENSYYYYCITPDTNQPNITKNADGSYQLFQEMSVSGDLIGMDVANYIELNQDMYLWVLESIGSNKKIVVSAKKMERPEYPKLREVFDYDNVFGNTGMEVKKDYVSVFFNDIIAKGNNTRRTFTLKIGEITDKNILNSLKNNQSDAWNSLLEYAKSSSALFNEKLTITGMSLSYDSDTEGKTINIDIKADAYYYAYVMFDDENGKYYPISEDITMGKGIVFEGDYSSTRITFIDDNLFQWGDLGVIETKEEEKTESNEENNSATKNENTDKSQAQSVNEGETNKSNSNLNSNEQSTSNKKTYNPITLPYTGTMSIGLIIVVMVGSAVFFKVKNNKYKGI